MRRRGDQEQIEDDRLSMSLAGFAVVLVVVVVSLIVVRKLQVRTILEACLMAQRPACEAAVDPIRVSRLLDHIFGS
jgi:hypothetical protein